LLATFVPAALDHLGRLGGDEICNRAGEIRLCRTLQGPAMTLSGRVRLQARRTQVHISSTMGRSRTAFWSPRRTILVALCLFAEDAAVDCAPTVWAPIAASEATRQGAPS